MIYLDHAATTPVPKAVADAMYTVLTEQYANPNNIPSDRKCAAAWRIGGL